MWYEGEVPPKFLLSPTGLPVRQCSRRRCYASLQCQGNDFDLFMLFTANFMLNSCTTRWEPTWPCRSQDCPLTSLACPALGAVAQHAYPPVDPLAL